VITLALYFAAVYTRVVRLSPGTFVLRIRRKSAGNGVAGQRFCSHEP
jgi:hypothetical protein